MPDITYLGNPNLKKANVAQNWTKKELVEYQKCMDSPQYFIENYVKIVSLDEGLVPFKMYDFQKEMVGTFTTIVSLSVSYPDSRVSLPSWFHICCTMHCLTQVLISQSLRIRLQLLVTYYHVCNLRMNIYRSGYNRE